MRIALTGATGFVGKALLPLLLEAGHDVVALVRNPSVQFDGRVKIVRGGMHDSQVLMTLTKSVDIVLHVAGVVSGVTKQDFFEPNVDGTLALAEAARRSGVARFIYVSSLAAREPELNFYGESKAAAETGLQEFGRYFNLIILRPSAVYGPGDTATLPLLKSLMSGTAYIPGVATARFSMVHVYDVAKILAEAVVGTRTGTFEIDDGSGGHSWPELIDVMQNAFGLPNRVVYIPRSIAMALGFAGDMLAHLRRKPSLLGQGQLRQVYHPDWCVTGMRWELEKFVSLQQGLPETIRWYQEQGLLPWHLAADRRLPSQDRTP